MIPKTRIFICSSLPSSPFSAFNSNEDKLTDFPIGGITTPCRLLPHHSRESSVARSPRSRLAKTAAPARDFPLPLEAENRAPGRQSRSEEHTSHRGLVCRLPVEKKRLVCRHSYNWCIR